MTQEREQFLKPYPQISERRWDPVQTNSQEFEKASNQEKCLDSLVNKMRLVLA